MYAFIHVYISHTSKSINYVDTNAVSPEHVIDPRFVTWKYTPVLFRSRKIVFKYVINEGDKDVSLIHP